MIHFSCIDTQIDKKIISITKEQVEHQNELIFTVDSTSLVNQEMLVPVFKGTVKQGSAELPSAARLQNILTL